MTDPDLPGPVAAGVDDDWRLDDEPLDLSECSVVLTLRHDDVAEYVQVFEHVGGTLYVAVPTTEHADARYCLGRPRSVEHEMLAFLDAEWQIESYDAEAADERVQRNIRNDGY